MYVCNKFVFSVVSALTSFGTFLSNTVYSLSDDVGAGFMQCMLFLSAWPAVEGIVSISQILDYCNFNIRIFVFKSCKNKNKLA